MLVFTNLSVAYLAVVGVNAGSFVLEYLLLRWVGRKNRRKKRLHGAWYCIGFWL